MKNLQTIIPETELPFLSGGGEMGERMRNHDWINHALGSPKQWPQSLRTSLSIILNSRLPQFLLWGDDLIFFYNDAYRPSLGNDGKHPGALGGHGKEVWAEVWPVIEPIFEKVFRGEAVVSEDQLVPIFRNGRMENVYWTFCSSPVRDETGAIAGIFSTCSDTTKTVLTMVENQRSLDLAMETGGLGSYRITLKTGTANFSPQIVDSFGLDRRVMNVQDFLSGIFAEDRARLGEALQAALTVTKAGRHDLVFRYANPGSGQTHYFRSVGKVVYDSGRPAFLSGIFQEITTQVLYQQRLEENEQQMRTLVHNSPFPIAVYTGREMRITLANPAILRAWGKGHDAIGKKYAEVLPEMENQQLFEQLDRVFMTGVAYEVKNQFIELHKDSALVPRYFDYSLTPLFNSEGEVYGIMNTGADTTEINLAHQALDRLTAERESAASNGQV